MAGGAAGTTTAPVGVTRGIGVTTRVENGVAVAAAADPVEVVGATTAGEVATADAGAVAVRNSAATQPSRPCASVTFVQRRPSTCCSSPVDMSGVPSGRTPTGSPPGARRIVSPCVPVPVT